MKYTEKGKLTYKTVCRACGGGLSFSASEVLTHDTAFSEHNEAARLEFVECPRCGMRNIKPDRGWNF